MNTHVKGKWWKLAGVVLFLYVLIGGMTVPLSPGISGVTPSTAVNGDTVKLNAIGYNTHFLSSTGLGGWLKLDSSHILEATTIKPTSETEAEFTFVLPVSFPDTSRIQPLTLIVDNATDGSFVQPNALFVSFTDIARSGPPWQSEIGKQLHKADGLRFPYRNILNETVRNTFFHIALWFAMFLLLLAGVFHAVKYLKTGFPEHDNKSAAYHKVAILFGVLGIVTGSVWAKFTWNTFWTTDVKLNMTAVAMLIYLAYLVLRNAVSDTDKRAKTSAAYSIFAFVALIPLVFVIPRLTDSLHPGNGGNPALGGEDLDNTLRLFFYPSILALTLMGNWMANLLIRYERVKEKIWYHS